MFEIDVWAYTHRGNRKEHNEDALQVFGFTSQSEDSGPVHFHGSTTAANLVVALADGVSNPAGGAIASRLAVDALHNLQGPLFDDEVATFRAVDERIRQDMKDGENSGMATTLIALLAAEDHLAVVSVGDSECHRWNQGSYLTRVNVSDAIPANELENSSQITQAMGGSADRETRPLEPHVFDTTVEEGDVFLLCSDGLTRDLSATQIERRLHGIDGRAIVEALVQDALDAGGGDNISVALVAFGFGSTAAPPADHLVAAATDPTADEREDRAKPTGPAGLAVIPAGAKLPPADTRARRPRRLGLPGRKWSR